MGYLRETYLGWRLRMPTPPLEVNPFAHHFSLWYKPYPQEFCLKIREEKLPKHIEDKGN